MKNINKNKRHWLNALNDSDTGTIQTQASLDPNGCLSVELTIRDCSRLIGLDFGGYPMYAGNFHSLDAKERTQVREDFVRRLKERRKKVNIIQKHLKLVSEMLDTAEERVIKLLDDADKSPS